MKIIFLSLLVVSSVGHAMIPFDSGVAPRPSDEARAELALKNLIQNHSVSICADGELSEANRSLNHQFGLVRTRVAETENQKLVMLTSVAVSTGPVGVVLCGIISIRQRNSSVPLTN